MVTPAPCGSVNHKTKEKGPQGPQARQALARLSGDQVKDLARLGLEFDAVGGVRY